MFRSRFAALAGCVAGVLAASVPAAQDHTAHASLPPAFADPMPLYPKALGTFSRPISSSVPEARAYFDQGFQLKYAFAEMDAARAFREAHRRDPDCAICFWGEAWSWGSALNVPMPAAWSPHAYAASRRALALLSDATSPVERALIEALAVRYVERFEPDTRRVQDETYAAAMQRVYERFPDDLDVATIYAEALFLLEPRRGARNIKAPSVLQILQVLEGALARDIRHVGACHFLIHLTEATEEPGRAEPCAAYIGTAVPGASHLNHMPSHTWNEVGRWGDSVRANLAAWHSDQKAAVGEGFAIYPTHNLHMLAYAASMDGQGAVAIQAAREYAKLTGDSMLHVLTLVRFGRFDDILTLGDPPRADIHVAVGVWEFGQGYARLNNGETSAARAHLERLRVAARTDAKFRFHDAADLLGVLGGILEGELQRVEGDLPGAIASFERAVMIQDRLIWDEPRPLPFPARHWLGAALVDAARFAEAERVYREDLQRHPKNGWSLFGLHRALEGQNLPIGEVARALETSWARSDTWLRRSSPHLMPRK